MSTVQVRPFRRADREQLTALVNAHIQVVVPGLAVSVNTVMSQLERDPGEFIVDPWVAERVTLVAEQRRRVVAAAHLLRYGAGEEVGKAYRDSAEISWLLFWPEASYWPDSAAAAGALMDACLDRLRAWGTGRWEADGRCPLPACTVCPSSGRTSARCTSGPGSSTRSGPGPSMTATPRSCCWPGSTSCPGRPSRPSVGCGPVGPSGPTAPGCRGRWTER